MSAHALFELHPGLVSAFLMMVGITGALLISMDRPRRSDVLDATGAALLSVGWILIWMGVM